MAVPCLRHEIRKELEVTHISRREDFRQPVGLGQQSGDKGHGEFC